MRYTDSIGLSKLSLRFSSSAVIMSDGEAAGNELDPTVCGRYLVTYYGQIGELLESTG